MKLFVRGQNFKLIIPKASQDRYLKAKNREAILGIRPEYIYDKEIKGTFPGGEPLRATVEVVEPVGSEVILLSSCGPDHLTACVDPQTSARPHAEMEFLVDMNRIHLFDKDTEDVYR